MDLSNSLNIWMTLVLSFWSSVLSECILDRLCAPSFVKVSALISNPPTSGILTPYKIILSRSPIRLLWISKFFFNRFMDSRMALVDATSARIISFLEFIMLSLVWSWRVKLTIWFSSSISRAVALLNLYSKLLIFFSSYTTWFSFSFNRLE